MSTNHEHSDQRDEARLAELLQREYASQQPSPAFTEALLRELDQAFVQTYHASPTDSYVSDALVPPAAEAMPKAAVVSRARSKSQVRPKRRVGLRLAMTLATAASLLFAVALWNSQSAYGWEAMMRALENCTWVQTVSQSASLSGWVSSPRGVVAIRSEDQIAYHNHREQTAAEYLSEHKVIYQQNLSTDIASLGAQALFRLFLQDQHSEAPRYELISESSRQITDPSDSKPVVELRTTFKILAAQESFLRLVFLLDPETHLPKSCRLAGKGKSPAHCFDFTYPTEGPDSIYALGISPETPVVDSLVNLESRLLALAREAEAGRLLSRLNTPAQKKDPTLPTVAPGDAVAENTDTTSVNNNRELNSENRGATTADALLEENSDIADQVIDVGPTTEVSESGKTLVASNPRRESKVLTWELPEQPLATVALANQINEQLTQCWQAQGISSGQPATDSEFLRRIYLDLTGRIPMVSEVYRFLEDASPDRREQLVDELLASRDHATHLATVWRTLLLPEGVDTSVYGGTDKFDKWLADRFEKNLPYDQLVRQLLLAEGRVSDSGPILFYAALKLNPEELAAKTSRTFLGMRMECAQCHDHPFDDSISQDDFWGFAAHFAQISRPQGKMEMTSSVLRVRDNQRGEVMLPDSDQVVPPSLPYALTIDKEPDDSLSRRELLVDWLATKQNSRFAKATVNRVWEHLFGQGLVDPVDDMRADNPAACPELLLSLSQDFAAGGYDLRRLLRAIVLSDAYQASSRSATDEPSQALAFARMNIKSFTADQLYDCIGVATQHEAMSSANNGSLSRIGNSSRESFIAQFRAPAGQRTDYHAGIPQALTLMHGRLIHGATDLSSSGLLKLLSAPHFTSNQQRIETLFLATLSRYPEPEELEKMLAHVEAASDDKQRSDALSDILWALLNSAEFTFIH